MKYVLDAKGLYKSKTGRTRVRSSSATTHAVKGLGFVGSALSLRRQGRRPAPHLAAVEAEAQEAYAARLLGAGAPRPPEASSPASLPRAPSSCLSSVRAHHPPKAP